MSSQWLRSVQICNQRSVSTSINAAEFNGTKKQQWRKQLLLLEIIEHDSVRHDLAEASNCIELSDKLYTQQKKIKNE